MISVVLPYAFVLVIAVSFGLYGAMMGFFWLALIRRGGRPVQPLPSSPPRVSILKPLAGNDDELDDNLESFSGIEYPSFEILLGVADGSDPACRAARAFVARHPELDARLVITDGRAAANPKVAQLMGLEPVATGEVYVISDSNVRVGETYLRSLIAELSDPEVGLVTSLFSGTGERTLGAAVENLQICASTAPGIASTAAVTGRPLTVGKSMALRRSDLARLGGFAALGHVLAEDHLLGRLILAAGLKARLSFDLVENRNIACSMARTIERHTRWAKMRRSLFPSGFAVEPLLSPVVMSTAWLLVAPSKIALGAWALACLTQTVCTLVSARFLRGSRVVWWFAPLEIVRAYLAAFCWLRAWESRRIAWRGHPFILHRGSVIVPLVSEEHESATRERFAA